MRRTLKRVYIAMLHLIGEQFRMPSGLLGRLISSLLKKGNMICDDRLLERMSVKPGDKVFEIDCSSSK